MGVHARIRCFCSSAVSPEDPPGTVSSDWCALTCGHIWHTKCAQKWAQQKKAEGISDGFICANKCPEMRVSKRDEVTGRRSPFNFVKLYFDDDVKSDSFDSSQIIDLGNDEPSSGGLRMGIAAYGQRFRPRPPKNGSRGRESAAVDDLPRGSDVEDEEEIVEEEEQDDAGARSEQELTRLRRELREATAAARQVGGLREQIERLNQTANQLQSDINDRDETITSLEDEAKERDEEIEQLELGQPKLKDELEQARTRIEVLEATRVALEDVVAELEGSVEERTKERDEVNNDLHETRIKAKEAISRLEDRLKSAGTEGEKKVKQMEQEVDQLNRVILDVRCEKDRLELQKKEEIKTLRARAAQEVAKAQKTAEEAESGKQAALDAAKVAKVELARLKGGNENWSEKYQRLRAKYEKVKMRRIAISDDEAGDEIPLPPTVVHSPDKSFRRLHSHRSALDGSPEALPFKLNINVGNHSTLASTQSTSVHHSPVPSPIKRKRPSSDCIVISSDEDQDYGSEEENEDLFAVDPFASGSGTWNGFSADARLPSESPASKKRRGASTVPMPTLAEAQRSSAAGPWRPKKVELTQQPSDKHLPNFASGAKELGPKSKIKMGTKRK